MPKFSQQPIPVNSPRAKGLPQEVIDQYKPYVEELTKGNEGTLVFGKSENIALGRKALVEAGVQLKKYVAVRKPRGLDNTLNFRRITKKEFDASKSKAKARGAKLKSRPRKKTKSRK